MAINLIPEENFQSLLSRPTKSYQQMNIGRATISGPMGQLRDVRDAMLNHVTDAVEHDGLRALENPRSAAIVHEAGHAVVYASFGLVVRYCKIKRERGRVSSDQWVGFTKAGAKWRSDLVTPPEQDIRQACCLMAGVTAEMLFDLKNYRQASSVDEIALAHALASNVALKLNCEVETAMARVIHATTEILQQNKNVVSRVASELDQKQAVRGRHLATLLADVTRSNVESLCIPLKRQISGLA